MTEIINSSSLSPNPNHTIALATHTSLCIGKTEMDPKSCYIAQKGRYCRSELKKTARFPFCGQWAYLIQSQGQTFQNPCASLYSFQNLIFLHIDILIYGGKREGQILYTDL